MFTPNGRFLTNKRLCLSMSDYHPEKWCPSWGVGTILVGLLSFMTSDDGEGKALGMLPKTSDQLKKKLAEESFEFNRNDQREHGPIFNELFTIFMWEEEERREHRLKRKRKILEETIENSSSIGSISGGSSPNVSLDGDSEMQVCEDSLMKEYDEAKTQALNKFLRPYQRFVAQKGTKKPIKNDVDKQQVS